MKSKVLPGIEEADIALNMAPEMAVAAG